MGLAGLVGSTGPIDLLAGVFYFFILLTKASIQNVSEKVRLIVTLGQRCFGCPPG
jgi:hypothetical protein